ncbi:MAG TPA: polyprenyl synthetase family protein [Panacibacter sp.]|nr:polyprenyl synthetase family protein [Panacibacter sp.]
MHSFEELAVDFKKRFEVKHFPEEPQSLYNSCDYILSLGGKRVRPVMCLMGNELFGEINPDIYHVAMAIELFHNFTLIHDDIMDAASLRRGMPTVHTKYSVNTALLGGDVMLVTAYEYLNKININNLHRVLTLFNKTAKEVCEGQQLDIDFEKMETVSLDEYIKMIVLKTSVALAASLQVGAILGGASEGNRRHIYEFGKNLGIAFQIQDDYLDAFGDPQKFGKDLGGDIRQNKKTFLLIHALEAAAADQKDELLQLMQQNPSDKVQRVKNIFKACNVDEWAWSLKQQYLDKALRHLDDMAVLSVRKKPLMQLAEYLIQREH